MSAQEAIALAAAGRGAEAVALIEAADDADSLALLGVWLVEGRLLPRDVARAQATLAKAEAAGNMGAARMLGALLAPADWPGALAVLDRWRERDPLAANQLDLIAAAPTVPMPDTVSDTPRIAWFRGLFTPAECAFLIDNAARRFKPAGVFDPVNRRFVEDKVRRADSAGFPLLSEWPAVHMLNRRLATASGTDVACGEPLNVLRYRPGQSYAPHLDAVPGLANQRVVTMLLWLNDDYDGGDTVFPKAGATLRGETGDALLFENVTADGRPDPATIHEGRPVTRGEKLLASRWIRARPSDDDGFGAHEVEAQ